MGASQPQIVCLDLNFQIPLVPKWKTKVLDVEVYAELSCLKAWSGASWLYIK